MKLTLALACLLAIPAVSLWAQQPPAITFTPATGPVHHYEARVRTRTVADTGLVAYEDIRYLSPDATPVIEFPMLPPVPYWIDVRAWSETTYYPWSPVHQLMPDLDDSGEVDARDLIRISQEWGEPDRDLAMFLAMVTHWGDATVWDEVLGLRRYIE